MHMVDHMRPAEAAAVRRPVVLLPFCARTEGEGRIACMRTRKSDERNRREPLGPDVRTGPDVRGGGPVISSQ